MNKLITVLLMVITILVSSCGYDVTEPADIQATTYVKDGVATIGELYFEFEAPSIYRGSSRNIIYVITHVTNNGKTSINANPDTYLIDNEGNQYDSESDAIYDAIRYLKKERYIYFENKYGDDFFDTLETGWLGFKIQPKMSEDIIWAFYLPTEKKSEYKFFQEYDYDKKLVLPMKLE